MPVLLIRSLGDLGLPVVRRTLFLSATIALVVLAALVVGTWALLAHLALTATGWLDTVADLAGGVGALVVAWFLFPAALAGIAGFFLEDVADAVEARHWPALGEAGRPPLATSILGALRLFGLMAVLNLLALPLYFVPIMNLLAFTLLNGYLLGREYVELVALRHLAPNDVLAFRRRHRLKLFGAGITIALLLTVPVVNLLTPVIATVFMVHVFHGLRRTGP
jgi:CysZ protein